MKFNSTLFKELLTLIETRLKFANDELTEEQCLDFKCNIDLEEIFKTINQPKERCKMEEFKYCIALLRQFEYVKISNGSINGITPAGFKFIMSQIHSNECKFNYNL